MSWSASEKIHPARTLPTSFPPIPSGRGFLDVLEAPSSGSRLEKPWSGRVDMRRNHFWLVPLALLLAGWSPPTAPKSDLVVHEWGTFLQMSGSDGVSLDGMYHEEHALPAFVHARGRDQLRPRSIFVKGETPVIYFYTNT